MKLFSIISICLKKSLILHIDLNIEYYGNTNELGATDL